MGALLFILAQRRGKKDKENTMAKCQAVMTWSPKFVTLIENYL